ncbi:type III PLP-dependent enzyme [Celeribacter marinus]|uniref:ornithine decarboxylase n=1 Tax=Celeribacter marinus TaxID=1397108 RepID=A0A0N9ZLF2_9RHOB|nr:type III PLP-dependent enzyme [Celeribacter marinus]ALI56504.1 ornithine decarboxylase / Arginine decarboxylase [Celeribacter marinus]SFK41251.1 ornithine decarboxylase [Celeribacter marinus]
MGLSNNIWASPADYLRNHAPEHPVLFFSPEILQANAHRFLSGFPGFVTYAVKANPDEAVLQNLVNAGICGFDVASPVEIDTIARLAPHAAMHYNNPVRSRSEIKHAVKAGVKSYSVDSRSELEKLGELVPSEGVEIAVRFKLPVDGAAYNFGAKFGATVDLARDLVMRAQALGFTVSLTFHPGTQCTDPAAWASYIHAAAGIGRDTGVRINRLNVGGGFPSHRLNDVIPQLDATFALIDRVTDEAFGADRPALVCEPGRALVAESYALATRVRAIRDDAHVFINDGIYGALSELHLVGVIDRIDAFGPEAQLRTGDPVLRTVFGPTCDSTDKLPSEIGFPCDMQEEDHVIFYGVGAYSVATATRFNGFGNLTVEIVQSQTCALRALAA